MNVAQLASHTHGTAGVTVTVLAAQEPANTLAPAAGVHLSKPTKAGPGQADRIYFTGVPASPVALGGVSTSGSVTNTGGGRGFNIRGPELGVNFSIALFGLFPSRP